jgi:tetratricopeptide (TPR) repeat protein
VKAVGYLRQAARQAMASSADLEAIQWLEKALGLLAGLPESRERHQQELDTRLALGAAQLAVRGYAAPETRQNFLRAQELGEELGQRAKLFEILLGTWYARLMRADLETMGEIAGWLRELADQEAAPGLQLAAHFAQGTTAFYAGAHARAGEHLNRVAALSDLDPQRDPAFVYVRHPVITAHSYAGLSSWFQGHPDRALESQEKALRLAEELSGPLPVAQATFFAAWVRYLRREAEVATELTESVVTAAKEHGFWFLLVATTAYGGAAKVEQGDIEGGISELKEGMAAYRSLGVELFYSGLLCFLGEACRKLGRAEEGLAAIDEALELARSTGDRLFEAEAHRLKGELLHLAEAESGVVESHFDQALLVARKQGAKALELRAATSLGRLWKSQGRREEAYALLDGVYGSFTEGLELQDLRDARKLLDELESKPGFQDQE